MFEKKRTVFIELSVLSLPFRAGILYTNSIVQLYASDGLSAASDLGGVMNIVMELALIFGVCLVGIGIAEFLPFTVPYSVLSLLVLTFLLYRKILKPEQITFIICFQHL